MADCTIVPDLLLGDDAAVTADMVIADMTYDNPAMRDRSSPGSGDVLVSSMSRDAMKEAAGDQAEAREDSGDQSPAATAAGATGSSSSATPAGLRGGGRATDSNSHSKDY